MSSTTTLTAPLPAVTSEKTPWPAGISPIDGIAIPGANESLIGIEVDGVWLNIRRDDDNHIETFTSDNNGLHIDAPWTAADVAGMVPRALALRSDIDSFDQNIHDTIDALATNFAFGLAVPIPVRPGGGQLKASGVPVVDEVPLWNFTQVPHPDRVALDESGTGVIFYASYRKIIVHGEIVTEKDQMLILEPEDLAVIVAWAEAFKKARSIVFTMMSHHLTTTIKAWLDGWKTTQLV